MFDDHSNFGYGVVAIAPAPANTGTTLSLGAGQGALFPAAPFNCTVWPAGVNPIASNAEIVRVTAIVGDDLTIDRAQEGTSAVAIAVGYQIANTTSVKVFKDMEDTMLQFVAAGGVSCTAPGVIFSNSNNVTFGAAGNVVTASFAGGGGGVAISADANSQSTGTVIFSNSNGISFGMDINGTLTASHNGITSQTVQPQSTQPVAASASNGSFLFSTLGFSDANGVTFGTGPGGVITASHNGITSQSSQVQSTQPVAASASNGAFVFSTLGFSDANGVTFGTSAGSIITASVGAGVAAGSIAAGANTVALGMVVFSNSNNVTFGLNGSTMTASASNAQSTQPVGASASNGSFAFSTLGFGDANGVTFGTSAGSIITASVAAAGGNASLVFWEPYQISTATQAVGVAGPGAGQISPGTLPLPMSVNYIQILHTCAATQSTYATQASASLTANAAALYTFRACIYSLGTGADSISLFSVASGSTAMTYGVSISVTNSTNASYTIGCSYPIQGASSFISTTYTTNQTNYSFSSNIATALNGPRFVDVPIGATLSAGNYWVAFFNSFSNSQAGPIVGLTSARLNVINAFFVGGPGDFRPVVFGQAATVDVPAFGIAGSLLTGGSPTPTVHTTAITNNGSCRRIYFQAR